MNKIHLSACCSSPIYDWPDNDICSDCKEHAEPMDDEDNEEEIDFYPCDNCDLPDACEDFGCAIKSGIKKDTGL